MTGLNVRNKKGWFVHVLSVEGCELVPGSSQHSIIYAMYIHRQVHDEDRG